MNPYETLNIPTDASQADIERAYTKAARAHHPDRGGDEATMRAVAQCYEILSDEAKRAEYDATGAMPGEGDDGRASALIELLAIVIGECVMHAIEKGIPIKNVDMIGRMERKLEESRQELWAKLRTFDKSIVQLTDACKMFTAVDGDNLLAVVIGRQLAELKQERIQVEQMLETHKQALETLDRHHFAFEKRPWDIGEAVGSWRELFTR
jgi:preprotein translocase subunit Sec63